MGKEDVTEPSGSPYDAEIAALESLDSRTPQEARRLEVLYDLDEEWLTDRGDDVYGDGQDN